MSRPRRYLGIRVRVTVGAFLLSLGTGLTVMGSQREIAFLVVAGVAVIVLGLRIFRPLAETLLTWLERRNM